MAHTHRNKIVARVVDVMMILFICAVSILYCIFLEDFVTRALTRCGLSVDASPGLSHVQQDFENDEFFTSRFFIGTLCVFFVLYPLSLCPDIRSLTYPTLIGLVGLSFTIGVIVVQYVKFGSMDSMCVCVYVYVCDFQTRTYTLYI